MRGFTLIEAIIYLALLSVLITGAMECLASIESSTNQDTQEQTELQESAFVMQKLDWAFSEARSIESPTGKGSALTLRMQDAALDPVALFLKDSAIVMQEGKGTAAPITTANVSASGLSFTVIPDASGNAIGIETTFMLDDRAFDMREYLP